MVFAIRLCPYCGGAIKADESGCYTCSECGKHTFRSRSNSKAFLLGKPYEEAYSDIMGVMEQDPKEALSQIDAIIEETEEPNPDMFIIRGLAYCSIGEEGKAHNDWKKGLDLITDVTNLDAYIVTICRRIAGLIVMKEREFLDFKPLEYIDLIATEFSLKGAVPCKGIFYITLYRDFRMGLQAGEFSCDDDIYPVVIPKILNRILVYGRNYQTTCGIIEEILEDFQYNDETYEEDDNLRLHLCYILRDKYLKLSEGFTDEDVVRILRHWNDENMFELEYWMDELMKSVKDRTILKTLSKFTSSDNENFDLEEAVENYAKKYLLLLPEEKEEPAKEPETEES